MPEAPEVRKMVQSVRPALLGRVITKVKLLCSPFGLPRTQQNWKELIEGANKSAPMKIIDLVSRGKEINLLTNKSSYRILFGQGAYLYYLSNEAFLEVEPFFSDGFLAFHLDNGGVFCIVDCRTTQHQVKLQKFYGRTPQWRNKNKFGPCVLNEPELFKKNFKEALRNNPTYFSTHSIAWIMFDQQYCNGFGDYSVSEILHRLYMKHQIKPWTIAMEVFSDRDKLEYFLNMPLQFQKEQELYYPNDYDPAAFGPKQRKARKEFRIHFLQVYRKMFTRDNVPITALMFKRPDIQGGRHSIYTCAINQKDIPELFTTKSCRIELLPEGSKFKVVPKDLDEVWYRIQPYIMTFNLLGVGMHDFLFIPGDEDLKEEDNKELQFLLEYGLPQNLNEKGPEKTEQLPEEEKNKRKRNGKRKSNNKLMKDKRSGKRQRRKKQKIFANGDIPVSIDEKESKDLLLAKFKDPLLIQ